jgi:hypothetical protein
MSESTTNGERHLDGKFAIGNRVAEGNVGNRKMKSLKKAFLDACDEQQVRVLARQLLKRALEEGSVPAARLWLEYALGKPPQAIELSGPDGQALGVRVVLAAVLQALTPFPEARLAVAGCLKELPQAQDAPPDEPTPEP